MTSANFPGLLEMFFTDRLIRQREVSAHTITGYRDTFRLLLAFAQKQLKKMPSTLTMEDLDASFIGAFLDHLEKNRGNSARTRNIRLAAIHSFFHYAAYYDPSHSALIQRVLAIPSKRYTRALIDFLTRPETEALLAMPDSETWTGRRDKTLLLLALQTGLRVSELTGLRCEDVVLGSGAHIHCRGKGRKERCTPLSKEGRGALRSWLHERHALPAEPLFPNARGGQLSRDGVEYLLAKHATRAAQKCPSLNNKRISPHVLRHTFAMQLVNDGVDSSVIALLLGHESMATVLVYIHANLELKKKALAKTTPLSVRPQFYKPNDRLITYLKNL